MNGIIGKKLGMTHYFTEEGRQIPVTVVQVETATVVSVRTEEKNGYSAVQAGFVDAKEKHVSKPKLGLYKKANVSAKRILKEFPIAEGSEPKVGDSWDISIFENVTSVSVTGISKGHGYSGTIKRHNFSRGPITHGSKNKREPGSTGQASYPARVFPGKKMPGQYGNVQVTVKNIKLEKMDAEKGVLFLKGAVPGAINSHVLIRKG